MNCWLRNMFFFFKSTGLHLSRRSCLVMSIALLNFTFSGIAEKAAILELILLTKMIFPMPWCHYFYNFLVMLAHNFLTFSFFSRNSLAKAWFFSLGFSQPFVLLLELFPHGGIRLPLFIYHIETMPSKSCLKTPARKPKHNEPS